MTDHLDSVEEPPEEQIAALGRLLASADLWDDPIAAIEESVVSAISQEAGAPTGSGVTIHQIDAVRARRSLPWWSMAAAAIVVIAVGALLATRGSDSPELAGGTAIALTGTELADTATASAVVSSTPAGLKIVLETEGLDGAPDGTFYEAWVSDGTTRVSCGTFHLRGGPNPIALWAGIDDPAFRRFSVTLEPADGDSSSSGQVVLAGDFREHDK